MNTRTFMTGMAVGLDAIPNLEFDINRPYRACFICGEVFQSEIDRRVPPGTLPANNMVAKIAKERRDAWANHHRFKHPIREHHALRASGRTMTPEAAHKLAAFGIIPVVDMVLDPEVKDALAKSSPIPQKDAEH